MKNKFIAFFILIIIFILCLMGVTACEKVPEKLVDIEYDLQESADATLKDATTL